MLLHSPDAASALVPTVIDPTAVDPLLGDRPPWLLGAGLAGLGALLGMALAAILLLTQSEETVSFPVTSVPPILAVRAPVGAQLDALYVAPGATVRVGDSLLRLRFVDDGPSRVRYEDIPSPSDGTVRFLAQALPGAAFTEGERMVGIEGPGATAQARGEVPASLAAELRHTQRVRLSSAAASGEPPVDATLLAVTPAADAAKSIVTFSLPHAAATAVAQDAGEDFTATAVLRRRGFTERGLELIHRISFLRAKN